MRRLAVKGLRALLTDVVTGEPLGHADRVSLAIGLAVTLVMIIIMLVLSLGLGAGQ